MSPRRKEATKHDHADETNPVRIRPLPGADQTGFHLCFFEGHAVQGSDRLVFPVPECLSPGNHNGTVVPVAGGGHGGLRAAGVPVPEYRRPAPGRGGIYGVRRSAHGTGAASAPPAHGLFHRGQHRQNQLRSVHRHGVHRGELYARYCRHDVLYLCPGYSGAVAGLPESLAGTGRPGGGADYLAAGPRISGEHPGPLRHPTGAERGAHTGGAGLCGGHRHRQDLQPAGRAFRAAHREFRPEPQGQHRVRGESGPLDAGPLSGVRSGLGADNPPVTLALWPWAALHHLPAGCLALRL